MASRRRDETERHEQRAEQDGIGQRVGRRTEVRAVGIDDGERPPQCFAGGVCGAPGALPAAPARRPPPACGRRPVRPGRKSSVRRRRAPGRAVRAT
jgi:hypothetical protein